MTDSGDAVKTGEFNSDKRNPENLFIYLIEKTQLHRSPIFRQMKRDSERPRSPPSCVAGKIICFPGVCV